MLKRVCFNARRNNLEDARDDAEKWVNFNDIDVVNVVEHYELMCVIVWYKEAKP